MANSLNPLFLLSFLTLFFFSSCNLNHFTVCQKRERACSYSYLFPGLISITKGGKYPSYYLLTEKKIEKLNFRYFGTPVAYNQKNKNLAIKSSDMFALKLSVVESVTGKYLNSVDLPVDAEQILSACFVDDNSLAVLYYDKNFRYFIALSSKEKFEDFTKWNSSLVFGKAALDIVSLHMLEPSILPEKPFSLQCGAGKAVYLHTTQMMNQDLRVVLYKFDPEKHKLFYKTSMFLPNTRGKINLFFNESTETDYVYHNNKLFMVQGGGFPESHFFGESGELLFSPLIENGFLLFFVSRQEQGNSVKARVLKF